MAHGDFHRLLGSFGWNGRDFLFVAEGETKEWIVDFAGENSGAMPVLRQPIVVEATQIGESWLLIDRLLPLGCFEESDRPETLWQRIMGRR